MSRTENTARNISWGVLQKAIALVLPFVTRTILIYTLGSLFLGLNGLFTSILQVLNISELGINTAITFSMYEPLAHGNDDKVNALLNFYKLCYRVIGFIVLGIGLAVMPFLPNLISGAIPEKVNIYWLYLIYLAGTFLSYELFAYRTALLVASQRSDIVSKVSSISTIIQFLLQTAILLFLRNYYLYIVVSNLTIVANNIICAYICKHIYPHLYCGGKIEKRVFNDIKKKVGGMIFQKIGGVVLTSVDTLVISSFLGLRILAIYQNYYFIITSLFGILAVIMSSMIATVGNAVALESIETNYKSFVKFNFLYIWIVGWCSICLLCMYQPFMELWVGTNLLLPDYMVILFSIYFFTHKWCDMLYVYQEACGIWWETKWVPITAAVVNLVINIVLVQFIGLAGILISTIVSVVFIYDIGYAKVLFKVYFKDKRLFRLYLFKQVFYLVTLIFTSGITALCCWQVKLNSMFLKLIINGIICVLLPNFMLGLMWRNLGEFDVAVEFVKGIIVKKIKRLGSHQ